MKKLLSFLSATSLIVTTSAATTACILDDTAKKSDTRVDISKLSRTKIVPWIDSRKIVDLSASSVDYSNKAINNAIDINKLIGDWAIKPNDVLGQAAQAFALPAIQDNAKIVTENMNSVKTRYATEYEASNNKVPANDNADYLEKRINNVCYNNAITLLGQKFTEKDLENIDLETADIKNFNTAHIAQVISAYILQKAEAQRGDLSQQQLNDLKSAERLLALQNLNINYAEEDNAKLQSIYGAQGDSITSVGIWQKSQEAAKQAAISSITLQLGFKVTPEADFTFEYEKDDTKVKSIKLTAKEDSKTFKGAVTFTVFEKKDLNDVVSEKTITPENNTLEAVKKSAISLIQNSFPDLVKDEVYAAEAWNIKYEKDFWYNSFKGASSTDQSGKDEKIFKKATNDSQGQIMMSAINSSPIVTGDVIILVNFVMGDLSTITKGKNTVLSMTSYSESELAKKVNARISELFGIKVEENSDYIMQVNSKPTPINPKGSVTITANPSSKNISGSCDFDIVVTF
ncbi:hypothetical protein SHELI_v1c11070 [Spiroplasma helicoides]|uniref:Lipoprotein n=1 Tax=Spiroplasma helicoides TaxID=216938 RepID=A0A1B3SM95_9MOLU|nr:lipoprotein [Spiroplasma helicoides]AOG61054.1 hypothetical protein SHELI_v1c11070 [Spiroplasma helicoides]